MKPWFPLGFLLLIIFIFGSPTSAQIYKWMDKDGNIRFSDAPPPKGVKAEKQRVRESTESSAGGEGQERPTGKAEPSNSPAKEKRPYGDITVLMYMTDWCPYCRKARETLNSLGVNLIEYNIDKDKEKREEMKQKGGTGGVPFMDIEGITIRGYSAEAIKAAVEKRRTL
jgi:glutaredoxin